MLAGLLGVAVAVLPSVASFATEPAIEASQGPYGGFSWNPSTAEVTEGGTVKFSNPSSTVPHGLRFTSSQPNCTGLPQKATEPSGEYNWKAECKFNAPGAYSFVCTVHPEMTGTITVTSAGTTTVTTQTTTGTTTGTPPPPSPSPAEESPLAGAPSQALKLAKSQRGGTVRGSIAISKAGAGGRLEVDLFARSASLANAKHHAAVRVGQLVRSSLSAGKASFSVRLNARARRALRRHKRLSLTVKLIVTPASGKSVTLTRTVVEHA